jgi:hypothetical protein
MKQAEAPKPKSGISALYVENSSGAEKDVLLCLSSTCFKVSALAMAVAAVGGYSVFGLSVMCDAVVRYPRGPTRAGGKCSSMCKRPAPPAPPTARALACVQCGASAAVRCVVPCARGCWLGPDQGNSAQCPLTVQQLNVSAWNIGTDGAAGTDLTRAASPAYGRGAASPAYVPREVTVTDSNTVVVLRVGQGAHLLQLLIPAGVEAQILASSDALLELGDEAILCEKLQMTMALERGKAPPLQMGKDVLWLRRSISVTAPTSLFVDLRITDPVLRNMVQLVLVKTSTGEMVEAAADSIGPVLLEPSDAGYSLLARSLIGALPEGYDVTSEEFTCPWLLRFIHAAAAAGGVVVAAAPTEFVFDANGYFVKNFGSELFRFEIRPPAPPEAEAAPEVCVWWWCGTGWSWEGRERVRRDGGREGKRERERERV